MADTAPPDTINLALELLGQEPVADLSSNSLQGSNAAVKVLRLADQARDITLRRHGWTCALQYVKLNPAVIPAYVAPPRWPFVYQLPGDALRVWSVDGHMCHDPFFWRGGFEGWRGLGGEWEVGSVDTSIGGRQIIRSRIGDHMDIAYVRRANWGAIDTHVLDAVAIQLAYRAAVSVTGDANIMTKMKALADDAVLIAISIDGTQASPEHPLGWSQAAMLRTSCE